MRAALPFVLACCAHAPPGGGATMSVAPASPGDPIAGVPENTATAVAKKRAPPATILDERFLGNSETNAAGLAIDTSGRRFVSGSFTGSIAFDPLPAMTSRGSYDGFLVVLDARGTPQWQKQIGGSSADFAQDVVVDAKGDLWLSGAFESPTIDLGGGPMRCAGIHDLYLGKFDSTGKLLFQKRYGDAYDQIDMGLRLDPSGGVAAFGWFNGSVDFGAGATASPFIKSTFVARVDDSGRGRWSKVFGHRIDYAGADAAFDRNGTLWVSGGSDAMSDFVPNGKPTQSYDLGPVVVAYDASGKRTFARRFGDGGDNLSSAIGVDGAGNVLVAAGSKGTIDFGGGPTQAPGHDTILVLAKLDPQGNHVWTTTITSGFLGAIGDLLVDAEGNAFVAATYLDPGDPSHSKSVSILVKVDPSGKEDWKLPVRQGIRDGISKLALDPEGNLVAAGTTGSRGGNRMHLMTIAR